MSFSETGRSGERVREFVEERCCKLIYLLPCSPDLNLIEETLAKLEARQLKKSEEGPRGFGRGHAWDFRTPSR